MVCANLKPNQGQEKAHTNLPLLSEQVALKSLVKNFTHRSLLFGYNSDHSSCPNLKIHSYVQWNNLTLNVL